MISFFHTHTRSYLTFFTKNWEMLLFGMLLVFTSSLGQTFYVSIFNPYLKKALDLTDGQIGAYYSAGTLASAVLLIWAGKLLDIIPLNRFVFVPCIGLAVAGLIAMSVNNTFWLVISFFLLRFFGQGLSAQTGVTTMARAFDEQRGKALSISSLGMSIGQAVLPVVGLICIGIVGWRTTFGLSSILATFVVLPAGLFLLTRSDRRAKVAEAIRHHSERDTNPAQASQIPLSKDFEQRQWTRGEMLRDYRFYLLVPAVISGPFVITAVTWNQFYIADVKGWSREWMASMLAVLALSHTVFSLMAGPFVDRITARRAMPFSVFPLALSMLVIIAIDHPVAATLLYALMGANGGFAMVSVSAMWPELYGIRHLGEIKALSSALTVFSTATAPFLVGVLIDFDLSLSQIMTVLLLYTVLAIVLAFFGAKDRSPSAIPRSTTDP